MDNSANIILCNMTNIFINIFIKRDDAPLLY